jgi:hypothetical protein
MANVNAPSGMRMVTDGGKQYHVKRYPVKTGVTLGDGDPVILDATGTVDVAIAGGTLLGVAAEYRASTSSVPDIAVYDDPDCVFEIQASANLVATDVGANAQLSAGSVDTATRRSTFKLDSSTITTTATHQLKIIGLSKVGTNAYGSYARALVRINNHAMKGGTGTAGV